MMCIAECRTKLHTPSLGYLVPRNINLPTGMCTHFQLSFAHKSRLRCSVPNETPFFLLALHVALVVAADASAKILEREFLLVEGATMLAGECDHAGCEAVVVLLLLF